MEEILNVLVNIMKLKEMPRSGWVLRGIKNPETVAEHTFRSAIASWILARNVRPKLDIAKVIKIALAHDLCEVYAGDIPPYLGLLPSNPGARREMLKHAIKLPQEIRKKREKEQHARESESLEKLIGGLPVHLKKEITHYWLDYERLRSREGRFVRQVDKIEALLQAIEYWGTGNDTPAVGWWEQAGRMVDDPSLVVFLKKIEQHFYKKKRATGELNLLLAIGKLKFMPRERWILRGVKFADTVANHVFLSALTVWLLGSRRGFSHEKALKAALSYKLSQLYAGDTITDEWEFSYGRPMRGKADKLPVQLKREKERRFSQSYRRESAALKKLVKPLPADLRGEIISLWDQAKRQVTFAGAFTAQAYWLATYLQALSYFKRDSSFPILGLYEQMRQYIYEPSLVEFLKLIDKKFLPESIRKLT